MASTGTKAGRVARAFSQGMIRQAEMVGRPMLANAMQIEADVRAEGRAVRAEGRLAKRTREAEERAAKLDYEKEMREAGRADKLYDKESQRWLDQQEILQGYNIENLEKRAELQEKSDISNFGRESAFKLKTWRMERYAAVRDYESKATNARELLDRKNNVSRAESADDKVDSILKSLGTAMKEGQTAETERLYRELGKAELQATEAWARIPGVDPLTTRELTDFVKFSIVGKEIVSAISLRTPDTTFGQAITAIKQGEGSSGYDAAFETVSRVIDDIIQSDPTFTHYRGVEKRDLKKHIIENMLPNLEVGEETATDRDTRIEEGVLKSSLFGGNPLDNIAKDITPKDIGTVKKAQAALDARPTRPGRVKSQEQKDLEKAQKRDPEYLLFHLRAEKTRIEKQLALPIYNPPRVQERLDKINELISRFERMLPELSMAQPAGMLNQGPGMIGAAEIFKADRMPMDPRSVNARYTA